MLTRFRPRSGRPARPRTRRSLREKVISTGIAARAVLFLVLGVIALSFSAPQQAQALFDTCDWAQQSINQKADMPGPAAENIFPSVKQWDGKRELVAGATKMDGPASKYTLYELSAMRGLNWASTQQSQHDAQQGDRGQAADDDECSLQNEIYNSIAQAIFDLSKIMSRAAISIKEISSNPSPLAALYDGTVSGDDSVVDRLNNGVFKLAVPTMILLTGLWVFGKWRKGDMREVWSGVGWAAFVVIAVSAFLVNGNYVAVVETADSGIAQGNAALTEAVLDSAIDGVDPPCDLPDNAPQRGMRISSCAMYDTLAFRPWAIGQFGDPGKARMEYKGTQKCDFGSEKRCTDLRVKQVIVQSVTNIEYYQHPSPVEVEENEKGDIIKAKENQYGELRHYIAENEDARIYEQWSGDKPANRISIGVYALVASLIVGLMVVVLSALTLLWHAVTLIMVILLPLVAIISIHPTQQKLLRGWWQTFVHSFVLRAGFGVILTILLLFYQLILPLQVPLGMQLLMLLLVTIAVIMLLKNLLSGKFSPQVQGADDALGVGDMAGKVTAMAPGLAASAAGSTARTTGRVASTTAKGTVRATGSTARGTAWAVDKLAFKGKGRAKMQEKGWLGQSKREQRQTAYQSSQVAQKNYDREFGEQGGQESPAPEPPRTRGRRVSGSSSAPAPQSTTPTESRPAPAPAPAPAAPAPQVPAPRPRPADPPVTPAAPAPTPPRRDPRGPSGRV
ncbi:hypothetical protein J2X68_003110 [Streptomyces sp. 3330]|uniref:hypothetical protein n=1 Tax=Streptomyces sp. 3330 TaxID=2817755 RepID=UPI00285A0627|nr:hypothetical protein [Streptomyces sp. 3330]MDR6976419.1 hypothetical protein [Streptomyces sp. 3330]